MLHWERKIKQYTSAIQNSSPELCVPLSPAWTLQRRLRALGSDSVPSLSLSLSVFPLSTIEGANSLSVCSSIIEIPLSFSFRPPHVLIPKGHGQTSLCLISFERVNTSDICQISGSHRLATGNHLTIQTGSGKAIGHECLSLLILSKWICDFTLVLNWTTLQRGDRNLIARCS